MSRQSLPAMFWQRALMVVLVAGLCWLGVTLSGPAQSSSIRLESRVDRLESELSRLRSQLTRLEAQVAGPNRAIASPPAGTPSLPNELSLEEQFDNLAVLAIELKQELRQLTDRVSTLEQTTATD